MEHLPGKKTSQRFMLSAVVCLAFFLLFAFLDGPFLEADSDSYYTFSVFREPGYPLFLALCRKLPHAEAALFQGYAGLYHAVLLQSLIWAFAVRRTGVCAADIAAGMFPDNKRVVSFAGWGAILMQFAVCLLNRFASGRGAMYANSVLTEAVAMPLYLLFIVQLFYLLRDGGKKHTVICAVLAAVLMLFRKHMTVTLLIWGFAAFILHLVLKKTRDVRRFLAQCVVIVGIFLSAQLITRLYNLALYDTFRPQAGTSEGMLCMLLYVSDENDVSLFRETEEEQRMWFEQIAAGQKAHGARYADVPAGSAWYVRQTYFTNNYDVIGYGIVHDVLFEAAGERLGADKPYNERVRAMYDLEGEIVPVLRRQGFSGYLRVYADNLLAGLLASNTRISPVFIPVSLMLYLLYALLFLRCGNRELRLFSFLVISGLLVNAGVVAAVIFSQPRYDIYGMGLFYTALMLLAFAKFPLFPYNKEHG